MCNKDCGGCGCGCSDEAQWLDLSVADEIKQKNFPAFCAWHTWISGEGGTYYPPILMNTTPANDGKTWSCLTA